jgi:hypothetical protein
VRVARRNTGTPAARTGGLAGRGGEESCMLQVCGFECTPHGEGGARLSGHEANMPLKAWL